MVVDVTRERVVPSTTARSYSGIFFRTKKRESGAVRRTWGGAATGSRLPQALECHRL